jgi:GPH family glycoside/pentoside/hexuronide:cation symporter
MAEPPKLSPFAPPAWGVGQIAVQIFRDLPNLLLLFYMTQALAIPPAMAGAAIFLPKLVWGVACDLGVGVISDRLKARVSRRLFLLLGAALAPIALILLFSAPAAGAPEARALSVAVALTFYMAVFAVFSVPHLAIGAELTRDPKQTSVVMAWRIAFSAVGLLIASSLGPVLVQQAGGGAEGYRFMAIVLAAVASASLVLAFLGSPRQSPQPENATRAGFRAAFANRRFLVLYGAFMLQLIGAGLAYATWLYLLQFNLKFENVFAVVGVLGLVIAACAFGAQPFWVMLSNRIGKRRVFVIGAIGYAASLAAFALAPEQNLAAAIACAILMGLTNSGCYQAAFAMLADTIEDDRRRNGGSNGGLYAALWVVNDKIAFALGGTLLAGLILSGFGFQAGAAAAQSASALSGIAVAFALAPGLLNAAAIALLVTGYRDEIAPLPLTEPVRA